MEAPRNRLAESSLQVGSCPVRMIKVGLERNRMVGDNNP